MSFYSDLLQFTVFLNHNDEEDQAKLLLSKKKKMCQSAGYRLIILGMLAYVGTGIRWNKMDLNFWCLTPHSVSAIFQLYHGDQF